MAQLRPARATLDNAADEAGFQAAVLDYAHLRGWRTYHTHDSRRSAAGFPDLMCVRGGRLVVAELKTEHGKLTTEQEAWLAELDDVERASFGIVRVFCWRPSDWPTIERVLR